MYTIELSRSADKFIKKSLPKIYLKKVYEALSELQEDPRPRNAIQMSGYNGDMYRLKIHPYRIVYQINDNTLYILIIDIAHRKDIYKDL